MLLLRDALNAEARPAQPRVWTTVPRPGRRPSAFRALVALAAFDPTATTGRAAAQGCRHLLLADRFTLASGRAPAAVGASLTAPLQRAFRSRKHPGTRRVAAGLLSQYVERPDQLVDLLADADADQFALLFPRSKQWRGRSPRSWSTK